MARASLIDHPAMRDLLRRLAADEFGGAASIAVAVGEALATALEAAKRGGLAAAGEAALGQLEACAAALLPHTGSFAPVQNLLHAVLAAAEAVVDAPPAGASSGAAVCVAARAAAREVVQRIASALPRVGEHGAALLPDGARVFTVSVSGSVWAVLEAARAQGKRISVAATESRPGNEGLQHIERLAARGIALELGVDAAMGHLLRGCHCALVGADAITARGDAWGKIGLLPLALLCREFGIPLWVAADTSKLCERTPANKFRPAADIVPAVAANVVVYNGLFELVPARLVTLYITEDGPSQPPALAARAAALPRSRTVANLQSGGERSPGASPHPKGKCTI